MHIPHIQEPTLDSRSYGVSRSPATGLEVPRAERDVAAFSYLLIMSVVVYAIRRQSAFVRFHSRQAIVLFLLSIGFWFIPYVGKVLELLVLWGVLFGFANAAQGHWMSVPVVGAIAQGRVLDIFRELIGLPLRLINGLRKWISPDKSKNLPLAHSDNEPMLSADSSTPTL